MNSIATDEMIRQIASRFTADLPACALKHARLRAKSKLGANANFSDLKDVDVTLALDKCKPWTLAVHDVFQDIARDYRWTPFPGFGKKPGQGEYLCDFTLFEEGYGCRVACESQWFWSNHKQEIDWAFDKLRGVKADINVFIYEGEVTSFDVAVQKHLNNSEQITTEEAFLALRWTKEKRLEASSWRPRVNGKQKAEFLPLAVV